MEIQDKLLTINSYSRSGEKQGTITNIVIHWVGNANSTALANRNYFENLKNSHKTYASAHYIIGLNGEIIRCIPDNEVAFHSGSYSMNRKSIGIENCHPDWEGKFNDNTYNSLVELCANLCKQYNIGINNIIRHYDVTGKSCPKYYVEHNDAWQQLKQDIQNKINGGSVTPVPTPEEGSDEEVRVYQNGSTAETVYSDSNCTIKLGSLNKYEKCDCFGIFNDRAMVRYQIGNTGNYKIGFCKWTGGVQ
jgi:N-acetylmuramoyl-L-alanine amidase CwlA